MLGTSTRLVAVLGVTMLIAQPGLRTPVVSVSTQTIFSPTVAARESVDVVVAASSSCASPSSCPSAYVFAVVGRSSTGRVFRTGLVTGNSRIVVRTPKPLCVDNETFQVQAAITTRTTTLRSGTGYSSWLSIRCRALTTVESAHRDSFPPTNHRLVLCTAWGQKLTSSERADALKENLQKMRTMQDSALEQNWWTALAVSPAESVYTPQTGGSTIVFTKGYRYPVASLAKNRYTGQVIIEDASWTLSDSTVVSIGRGVAPDARCETERLKYQQERAG